MVFASVIFKRCVVEGLLGVSPPAKVGKSWRDKGSADSWAPIIFYIYLIVCFSVRRWQSGLLRRPYEPVSRQDARVRIPPGAHRWSGRGLGRVLDNVFDVLGVG